MTEEISPQQFATSFNRLLEWASGAARENRAPFSTLLAEHFGTDPAQFPVTAETVATYQLPNLQLALDAALAGDGTEHRLLGFAGPVEHMELSLPGLVHDARFGLEPGPVRRRVLELAEGKSLPCVTTGLYLVADGSRRLALLTTEGSRHMGSEGLRIEVLSREPADGEQFIADLRTSMRELSVYRGKVLDLVGGEHPMMGQGASVVFRTVPTVQREEIVLPDGVLENVELHTVEFARHSDALRARGRHVRRGLLLHGPPGTGKTLTASYLIRRLEGRTVVILSGGGLGLIRDACALARDLSPGLVVLEDVDLVAQERTMHFGTSLLFDLLNEIDGIGEDEDVIFLMTTNRADLLEPALAARPGRVDQAVELPLPDAAGRDRLLELFSRGLTLDLSDRASLVEATEGTSPAFLRELVRKAALFAATREQDQVDDSHFASALALLEQGGGVTKKILGAGGDAGSPGRPDDADWYE